MRNVAVAYGGKLISILSVNSINLKIKENDDDELKKKKQDGDKSKYYYQCAKEIEEVRSGEIVRTLTGGKWKPATVMEKIEPRSYILRADNDKKVQTK